MSVSTETILATMLNNDRFTEWMGLVIDEYKTGYCQLHFTIREEMLNGFGIVHGGILFAAADSAFAFACNSHGRLSVALDVHISFIKSAKAGEIITITAQELHSGNRTGFYDIKLTNEAGQLVAAFKGTAYRTDREVVEKNQ